VFIVERSTEGFNYSGIGTVSAANTTGIHQYQFTDPNVTALNKPRIYYRLQQKDLDGRITYSQIIVLSLDNSNILLLYPNPVDKSINLTITTATTGKAQARIIDNNGRILRQQLIDLTAGSTSLSMDVSGLAKGIYYLELKGEAINERKQFVKR
jgi:hypothetical protein